VAVKTGTTDQFRDAWTIGYSPNLVVGAWVGNNDNSPMVKAAGGYAVAPLWNNFFRFAAKKLELEPVEFVKPETPKSDKPMVGGNFANERVFKVDKITGKLATQFTPPELVEEQTFRETHTILHYIFPDNPQGPIPGPEKRDPMYPVWEKTVQEWLARQPDSASFNQTPPSEFDDVHEPENQPQIKIISPFKQTEIKKGTIINFEVQVKTRFPIQQVDFYANENLIGTDFKAPFAVPVQLNNEGQVTLKATAFDSVLNSGKAQTSVTVIGN
jgi:membrane carboxypeptidase/penicillin-binding protein PbpC